MSRTILVLVACAFALFSCSKVKEDAENKAAGALVSNLEKKAGGNMKAGELCPSWPKSVPLYPGAKIIGCQEIDTPDGGDPQIAAVLAARAGKTAAPSVALSKILTVGTEVKATPDEIVAFYKKSLSKYESSTETEGAMSLTGFANKTDASDPVYAILLMPMGKAEDPGVTSSSIMVTLKRN